MYVCVCVCSFLLYSHVRLLSFRVRCIRVVQNPPDYNSHSYEKPLKIFVVVVSVRNGVAAAMAIQMNEQRSIIG